MNKLFLTQQVMVYVLGQRDQQSQNVELINIDTVVLDNARVDRFRQADPFIAFDGGHHNFPECTLNSMKSLLAQGVRRFWLPVILMGDDKLVINRGTALASSTNIGFANPTNTTRDYNLNNADIEPIVGETLTSPLTKTLRRVYRGVGNAGVNHHSKQQPFLTVDEVVQFVNTHDVEVYFEIQAQDPATYPLSVSESLYQSLEVLGALKSRTFVAYMFDAGNFYEAEYRTWAPRWRAENIGVTMTLAYRNPNNLAVRLVQDLTLLKSMNLYGVVGDSNIWTPSAVQYCKGIGLQVISNYNTLQTDHAALREVGVDRIITGDPLYALDIRTKYISFRTMHYPIGYVEVPTSTNLPNQLAIRGRFRARNDASTPLCMVPDRSVAGRRYVLGSLKLSQEEAAGTYDIQFRFRVGTETQQFNDFPVYVNVIMAATEDRYDVGQYYNLIVGRRVSGNFNYLQLYQNGTVSLGSSNLIDAQLATGVTHTLNIRVTPTQISAFLGSLSLTLTTPNPKRGPYLGLSEGLVTPQAYTMGYESIEVGKNLF